MKHLIDDIPECSTEPSVQYSIDYFIAIPDDYTECSREYSTVCSIHYSVVTLNIPLVVSLSFP